MEWVVIAIVGVLLYIVRSLEVITIKFKNREEPPKVETKVNDKQLKE